MKHATPWTHAPTRTDVTPARRWLAILLCGVCGAWTAPARAERPQEVMKRGAEAFQAGRFEEALQAFSSLGDPPPRAYAAEILHNRAAAAFKLGQTEEARELWVRAAALADPVLEAVIRYNLGNWEYAAALAALSQEDAQTALRHLETAGANYLDAVRLDPALTDARANLELSARLIKQIREQATSQPQSQPSSQPTSDQSQQDSSGQSDQEDEDAQKQPSSDASQDDASQDPSQDQQPQEQEQEQKQGSDQPHDDSDSPTSQPESQPSEPQAPQSQPNPSDAEALAPESQPFELSNLEAERLLQMIRDLEKKRREMLRLREAARHKPVDQDW